MKTDLTKPSARRLPPLATAGRGDMEVQEGQRHHHAHRRVRRSRGGGRRTLGRILLPRPARTAGRAEDANRGANRAAPTAHGVRTRWSVGKPAVLIPNLLQRQFTVTRRNKAWVTDITYIRTWQGWLYLAVVMDLFSRKIVGWSAGPTIHRELVLDAVLMAVRCRRPRSTVIHSDQGTQYGSDAWRRFCRSNHLEPSMSRKGNCWDNAVAESFFSSLKKERIKKQIYKNRELASNDVADYIDRFYNRTRRHSHPRCSDLAPHEMVPGLVGADGCYTMTVAAPLDPGHHAIAFRCWDQWSSQLRFDWSTSKKLPAAEGADAADKDAEE